MGFFDEKEKDEIEWKINETNTYDLDDEEEEEKRDETPLKEVDPEFKKTLVRAKHSIYEETILKPDEDSKEAQSLELLDEYTMFIQLFYLLAIRAKNGELVGSADITLFPESSRKMVEGTLHWIHDFFRQNTPDDTLPYSYYIEMMLRELPFYQEENLN